MIKKLIFFTAKSFQRSRKFTNQCLYRDITSLNGTWNYIVDPYETGFYNYRNKPFENQKFPENGEKKKAYFI